MPTDTGNPSPQSPPVEDTQGPRIFETPSSMAEFPVPDQREDLQIRRSSSSAGSNGSGGRRDSSPRSTSIWGPTLDLLYTASTGGAAMFGFIMDDDPISAGFKTHQRRLNEAAAAAAAALSGACDGDSTSSSDDEDMTGGHRMDALGTDTSLHGATMHGFNDSSHGKSLMSSTHSLSISLLDSSHGRSLLDSSHGRSLLDSSHGGKSMVDSDHGTPGVAAGGPGAGRVGQGVKRFLSNSLSFDSEHSDLDSLRGMDVIKSFPSRSNALEGISEMAPVSSSTSGTASTASAPPAPQTATMGTLGSGVVASVASAGLSSTSRLSGSADDASMRRHSRHHNELHRRKRTEERDGVYPMTEGSTTPVSPDDIALTGAVSSVSSESATRPVAPPSSSPPPSHRPSSGGTGGGGSDPSLGVPSKLVARPVTSLRPEVLASAGMRPISPPRPEAEPPQQPQPRPPQPQHAEIGISSSLSTNFVSEGSLGPSLRGGASVDLQNYSLGDVSMEGMIRVEGGSGTAAAVAPVAQLGLGAAHSDHNPQGIYNNSHGNWLSRTNSLNISRAGSGGGGGSYDISDLDMRALLEDGIMSPPPPLDLKVVSGRPDFPSSSSGSGAAPMSPRRYALYRSNSASHRYPHDYQLNSSLSFGAGHPGFGSASGGSVDMSEVGTTRGEPMLHRTSSVGARHQMMYLSGGGVGSNSNGNMLGNMSSEWADFPLASRQSSLGSFSADAMQLFDESLDVPTHGAGSMSRSGSGDWVGGGPALARHPASRGSSPADAPPQMVLRQQQQYQQQYQQQGGTEFGYQPSPSRMQSLAGSVRNLSIERAAAGSSSISDTMYHPKGLHQHNSSSDDAGGKSKKGRGKYKCGRCGAPKANHVCAFEVGAPVCSVATQGLLVGPFHFVPPQPQQPARPPLPVWFANPALFEANDRVITSRRWIQQCSPAEHGEEAGGGDDPQRIYPQQPQQHQTYQQHDQQVQYGSSDRVQGDGLREATLTRSTMDSMSLTTEGVRGMSSAQGEGRGGASDASSSGEGNDGEAIARAMAMAMEGFVGGDALDYGSGERAPGYFPPGRDPPFMFT